MPNIIFEHHYHFSYFTFHIYFRTRPLACSLIKKTSIQIKEAMKLKSNLVIVPKDNLKGRCRSQLKVE